MQLESTHSTLSWRNYKWLRVKIYFLLHKTQYTGKEKKSYSLLRGVEFSRLGGRCSPSWLASKILEKKIFIWVQGWAPFIALYWCYWFHQKSTQRFCFQKEICSRPKVKDFPIGNYIENYWKTNANAINQKLWIYRRKAIETFRDRSVDIVAGEITVQ